MKSTLRRAGKYKAKLDGSVFNRRQTAYGLVQRSRFRAAISKQIRIERAVKKIITAAGVMPGLHHFYMVFAKELYNRILKFRGESLAVEVHALQIKWGGRGLDTDILDQIKIWFGLQVGPNFCLFDVGLFDVCLFG